MLSLLSQFSILLITIFIPTLYSQNCTNFSAAVGCLSCDQPNMNLTLNISEMKYICIANQNCIQVTGLVCTACVAPYFLDSSNNCTVSLPGCLSYNPSSSLCLICNKNYYLNTTNGSGVCLQKSIPYCSIYNTASATATPSCLTCLY